MGSNSVVLGTRPHGVADGGGDEPELADVDEDMEAGGEAEDITGETATRTATDTHTVIETGALATND